MEDWYESMMRLKEAYYLIKYTANKKIIIWSLNDVPLFSAIDGRYKWFWFYDRFTINLESINDNLCVAFFYILFLHITFVSVMEVLFNFFYIKRCVFWAISQEIYFVQLFPISFWSIGKSNDSLSFTRGTRHGCNHNLCTILFKKNFYYLKS